MSQVAQSLRSRFQPFGKVLPIVSVPPLFSGLLALLYYGLSEHLIGTGIMYPDNYNYIAYWQQIVHHSFHTTLLQTPKPFLVLSFGLLHDLTGGAEFLIPLAVIVGALTIYLVALVAYEHLGTCVAAAAVGIFLLSNYTLNEILSGTSESFSFLLLMLLIARHVKAQRFRAPDFLTSLVLLILNLMRPENWVITILCAASYAVYIATRRPAIRPWRELLVLLLPLIAIPAWLLFDQIAFGNWLFSTVRTRYFADVANMLSGASQTVSPWEFPYTFYRLVDGVVSAYLAPFAVVGAIVAVARRPRLSVLLAILFVSIFLFYFMANATGMIVFDSFLLVPVSVILLGAAIGIVEISRWLMLQRVNWLETVRGGRLSIALRVVAIVVLVALVAAPALLQLKQAAADARLQSKIRESDLLAATVIKQDSDYTAQTPVIVQVWELTLVTWLLGSDGSNTSDWMTWIYDGEQTAAFRSVAYFIWDPSVPGARSPKIDSLASRLIDNKIPGFQTRVIFDDSLTRVYKVERVT